MFFNKGNTGGSSRLLVHRFEVKEEIDRNLEFLDNGLTSPREITVSGP